MKIKNKLYWAVALVGVLAIAGAAVTLTSRLTAASSTPDGCSQSSQATEAPGTETADDNCSSDAQDANEAENGTDAKDANEAEGAADDSSQPGQLDDGKGLLPQAKISVDAAIAAAQGVASGTIGQVDLEDHHGKLEFNVDVGSQEVKVDALTGAVLAKDTND